MEEVNRKEKSKKIKWNKQIAESVLTIFFAMLFLGMFAFPMGLANMFNTLMNTAYHLLIDTVLYIMAIAVIAGSVSSVFLEFGVVDLLNRILSPLMKPIYALPGAAALGIITTYLSDNPAILTLAKDKEYQKCFKPYQIPALTNIGTAFGMGLIVSSFVLSLGSEIGPETGIAVLCGNLGAIAGSILSTRLMLRYTRKVIIDDDLKMDFVDRSEKDDIRYQKKTVALRLLESLMKGGKAGVELGLGIIPGVLVICTMVMMLTYGPSAKGIYTGAAYEGIALIPAIAEKLQLVIKPLFGFTSAECIAVPVTALGSAGAALGLIPKLIQQKLASGNDLAVFTAMCMCWSGYLSTHVSMMEALNFGRFSGKAILYHTFGGLFAGVTAHLLFIAFV